MESIRTVTAKLLLVYLSTGIGAIVTKPSVTEVAVGGSTYLNCSSDSRQKISWFRTEFGSTQENFIYRDDTFLPSLSGRFKMKRNEATGANNLVVSPVQIRDAGIYRCQEATGQGINETNQLIVLDSDPVCEPQMETYEIIGPNNCGIDPNRLALSCTVIYHGNEAPVMEWRRASDNLPVNEGVTHRTIDNNRVVYTLAIEGDSSVKDGDSYFCNTTRSATSNVGCKSGKIKIKGTAVKQPACVPSEICQPYIKPYTDAIICILMIVLPAAIAGTVFVIWCRRINRRRTSQQNVSDSAYKQETGKTEEKTNLNSSRSSEEFNGQDIITEMPGTKLNMSQEPIGQLSKTIDDLTRSNQSKANKITDLQKIIDYLKQSDQSNKAEIVRLNLKNVRLQSEVEDLEQRLYPKAEDIDYLEKPMLVHRIELSEKIQLRPISGITILDTELFVVTKCSQKVEVFDSKTFQHQRNLEIFIMTDPLDIASSKDAKCLYVFNRAGDNAEGSVLRIDLSGNIINQWPASGGKGRLSTYKFNVILCLSDKQTITEYSPEGESLVTVRLSPAAKLNNPLHAIKVTRKCFVVSHGDFTDVLHRVCIVDLEGNIRKECRKWKESASTSRTTIRVPLCLVEDNERSVIVADTDQNRILLLSSMLKYQRKLIEGENGLKDSPVRLCFDETQSRLFVAVNKWNSSNGQWEKGRVEIFNVK